ncbi:putative DNA-binding transcriptional regulator YafY [Paenibacillus taihuensis]|uniref:Putative DNA-binding transcriptional regulator YafY n=1 Tax=Paenibacillus taihuensis TaxID=1156355 RepID=A0A3D9RM59_9BACL|nr:YafY family protein [Paenibacillus taihuensis]REE80989.1 putative DNA-binding transcriptional regulator YafY [Paenibacillus taihuensis]
MKLERLISITYMLLNHEVVSASELSCKYGVSQRTIYRDIEAICAAGIPIVSYQGANGGYGIMKEYKMDKSLLNSDDIASLITLLNSTTTVFDDERAHDTIQRLKTVQTDNNRAPSLTMDLGSWRSYTTHLRTLHSAINARQLVRFHYMNAKDERQDRVVEPVSLLLKYDSWYLYGYCRSRDDYRVFKLTRMSELTALPELFERHHNIHTEDIFTGGGESHEYTEHAVIHFAAGTLAKVLDEFYMDEKQFNEDGTLTLTIVKRIDTDWLIEKMLSFGEDAVVLEPPVLRQRIRDKIGKMMNRYEEV